MAGIVSHVINPNLAQTLVILTSSVDASVQIPLPAPNLGGKGRGITFGSGWYMTIVGTPAVVNLGAAATVPAVTGPFTGGSIHPVGVVPFPFSILPLTYVHAISLDGTDGYVVLTNFLPYF